MQIDILYRPAHAVAQVRLAAGEAMVAESGALVGMTPNVQMGTAMGGFGAAVKRLFGGESFFRNTFTAVGGPGELLLAPALCGDLVILDAGERPWCVQGSSFVASGPAVDVDTKLGGFKTFFAGEGLFVLRTRGAGPLVVGAFGGLERIDVDGSYIVDTGHLVAWDAGLEFTVGRSADGWISSFVSGEGLVCHFSGRGTVWIQTRNPAAYGSALGALLPPRES